MNRQDLHNRLGEGKQVRLNLNEKSLPTDFDHPLDIEEILTATCKAVVGLLKVDHSGLMVFDSTRGNGHIISEYPAIGTKGLTIQLNGVAAEQRLIASRQPIAVPNIFLDPLFAPVSGLLGRHGIQSVLLVPLISKDTLIGSLGLDMIGDLHDFTDHEIKLAEVFAQQAAAVIDLHKQNIALYKQNSYKAKQLAVIHSTGQALSSYEDIRSLLDEITSQAVQLVGGTDGGISEFNLERGEFRVIADYKFPELIGTRITLWEGLAGVVIRQDLPFKAVSDYNKYTEKAPALAKTNRFGAVLMIHLRCQSHTVGVLYINAERGHAFPRELPATLELLASTAVMAISNFHLSNGAENARERIRSSFEFVNVLSSDPDSKRLAQDISDQTAKAANAAWVSLVIFDDKGGCQIFRSPSNDKPIDIKRRIRPSGLTRRVLRGGKPYRNEDISQAPEEINDAMVEEGCKAALCLPLQFTGVQRGVIWIHYREPRKFSDDEINLLQAYLTQATIAYDNTRKMEAMEPLRLVCESPAGTTNTQEVMERIVASARNLFHADVAVLWPHLEMGADSLPVREAVTSGVEDAVREEMLESGLPIGDVTRLVMREGWLSVSDVKNSQLSLPDISRQVLQRLGAKSFEGIGLVVGKEEFGVIYLVHKNHREFNDEETRTALIFATHAARALKKAKLDQSVKGRMRAAEISVLAALVDLEKTLTNIVASIKDTLQCDAVTLFVYDEDTNRILPLTIMTGVVDMKLVTQSKEAPRDSIVYKMLEKDQPYRVLRVAQDELFRVQPFAKRENIKSVCAIPLKVEDHRVGVVFVNYRKHHTFSSEELNNIQPIINQAADAISNNSRYKEQNELVKLSKELLGAKSLNDSLAFAVKNAADSLGADFVAIALLDENGELRISQWCGWTDEDVTAYKKDVGENQARFTIEKGRPVVVEDYHSEIRFPVPQIVKDKRIKCGISVPMFSGDKPVGAMLAHFLSPRPFLSAQARPLSLIANLTAISVQSVERLATVKRAAEEISKIKVGTEQKEVLDKIVVHTVEGLPEAFLGTIQTYDAGRNVLIFESGYVRKNGSVTRMPREGEERLLRRQLGKRIGISGRAVEKKAPQLVNDVSQDPDYFQISDVTKSELAVPLLRDSGEVLGVLNVESKSESAFSEGDQQAMLALAELVVTTIQNVEQYRLLEGSTLLAWFGMASSVWGHIVAAKSFNIRNKVMLLREFLNEYVLEPAVRELIEDKLSAIDKTAEQIRREPIIAHLHSSEGLADVNINGLIAERLERLWCKAPYRNAQYDLQLTKDNPVVRCNSDWIKRMLDILIDNALDAMSGGTTPAVTVATRVIEGVQVEITITDNGPGIPPEVRDKLLKQRIEKAPSAKGLGLGLLMVKAIAEIYKGKVGIAKTGSDGTTMFVRLPVVFH